MTNSPSVEHTQDEQHTAEVSKVITMDNKVTFEVTNSNIWLNHLATTTIIQVVLSFLSFAVVRGWWSAIVLSFAVVSSADLLSRFSQQSFSADLSQQIFSADLLSRSSHLLWSGVGGQLLSYHSYHLLWSGVGGQLLSYHLLWSGVGGQLLSYHVGGLYCMSSLEGPFRGAFGKKG